MTLNGLSVGAAFGSEASRTLAPLGRYIESVMVDCNFFAQWKSRSMSEKDLGRESRAQVPSNIGAICSPHIGL